MRKTVDGRLTYKGEFHSRSVCRVRVYKEEHKPPVAIVEDMEENTGAPIFTSAEALGELLWKKLKEPDAFVFLHYTPGGEEFGIEFSEVTFHRAGAWEIRPGTGAFSEPDNSLMADWCPRPREWVEEMIGESLAEHEAERAEPMAEPVPTAGL
jgi:hypothetical protein